ncbi:uncharacterized protein METZ01_LOCUS47801 [marine metagenome]|uniref:Uncharacterized protein n=1 Tax=marine metagenome TaxID=408172 RepID=A0A381RY86_9ZZZZ
MLQEDTEVHSVKTENIFSQRTNQTTV